MSGMPPPPPRAPGSSLRRAALEAAAAAAGGGAPPDAQQAHGGLLRDAGMPLPLPWTDYFDGQQRVHCREREATFNVYTGGISGPVVLCLHGGGYTGLSWALIAKRLKDRRAAAAGHCTAPICFEDPLCRIVAPDLRCHGLTEAADEDDLSAATLAADVASLWRHMFGQDGGSGSGSGGGGSGCEPAAQQQAAGAIGAAASPAAGSGAQQGAAPPTVLVGHSMGGAVAVHAAASGGIPGLAGIVVVDVVEGTAVASLPYMAAVLQKRPRRFASLQQAVDWAMDTGMCKRQEAAHVSLPSMLRQPQAGEAAGELGALTCGCGGLETLAEEGEEEEGEGQEQQQQQQQQEQEQEQRPPRSPQPAAAGSDGSGGTEGGGAGEGEGGWVWRTPLERSAPFWEGWYVGLSDAFLKLPVPKVLVLVGTDRLDRSLTIGQMQGKFQPVLLPQAGHAVHEDEPDQTADAIATFIKRFRIGEPPLAVPRPAAGLPPVLPVAMGPAFVPPPPQEQQQQQQDQQP